MKERKFGKLEAAVRNEAAIEVTLMNDFSQLGKLKHNQVCKELVKLYEKHNYPMTQLVYIGVGKNAHQTQVFTNGFKDIDTERIELVIKLSEIFANKFGKKWRNNAFLCHTIDRYLSITKHRKELKFRQLVNACDVNFDTISYKTAKQFAKDFFGNEAVYNNNGYIVEIKDCM